MHTAHYTVAQIVFNPLNPTCKTLDESRQDIFDQSKADVNQLKPIFDQGRGLGIKV